MSEGDLDMSQTNVMEATKIDMHMRKKIIHFMKTHVYYSTCLTKQIYINPLPLKKITHTSANQPICISHDI
jgi:hypothetical protein